MDGGILNLSASTLRMLTSAPTVHRIQVQDGGSLILSGGDLPSRLAAEDLDDRWGGDTRAADFDFALTVAPRGLLAGRRCEVLGAGVNQAYFYAYQTTTAILSSGTVDLRDCRILGGGGALATTGGELRLSNVFIGNLTGIAARINATRTTVENAEFSGQVAFLHMNSLVARNVVLNTSPAELFPLAFEANSETLTLANTTVRGGATCVSVHTSMVEFDGLRLGECGQLGSLRNASVEIRRLTSASKSAFTIRDSTLRVQDTDTDQGEPFDVILEGVSANATVLNASRLGTITNRASKGLVEWAGELQIRVHAGNASCPGRFLLEPLAVQGVPVAAGSFASVEGPLNESCAWSAWLPFKTFEYEGNQLTLHRFPNRWRLRLGNVTEEVVTGPTTTIFNVGLPGQPLEPPQCCAGQEAKRSASVGSFWVAAAAALALGYARRRAD
ncbi:MAG: hypothetical protein HYT80_04420 [Euryarchaeota archaeon]|nr:hypothetical protein [Euryarchaeota archaeon]